jgi:hypothetical protein
MGHPVKGGTAPEKGGTQPWNYDMFDVLADCVVVGRLMKVTAVTETPRGCRMARSHAAAGARP